MIHQFPLESRPTANAPYTVTESGLSDSELDAIIAHGAGLSYEPIKVYNGDGSVDAHGAHFGKTEDTAWVYDRMATKIMSENEHTYRYDLTGFHENFYLNRYDGTTKQYFDWHYDMGRQTPSPRKLTAVLHLTDPEDYVGGNLEIMSVNAPIVTRRKRGLIVMFPSYKAHRVTPVEFGVRQTLVMFVTGPNFR